MQYRQYSRGQYRDLPAKGDVPRPPPPCSSSILNSSTLPFGRIITPIGDGGKVMASALQARSGQEETERHRELSGLRLKTRRDTQSGQGSTASKCNGCCGTQSSKPHVPQLRECSDSRQWPMRASAVHVQWCRRTASQSCQRGITLFFLLGLLAVRRALARQTAAQQSTCSSREQTQQQGSCLRDPLV